MEITDKIFVGGHTGMVGSAIVRLLEQERYQNIILRSRAELDLRNSLAVADFFKNEKPAVVILAAAKVGGIKANMMYPAEFLYDNLRIQNNVIHQAYRHGVKEFCFLGSSCIYPRECPQPMKEEYLLTGPLEPTNEGYALAKIAGIKMIEYYKKQYGFCGFSILPCNLYGTNDSFDPEHSHVLSALVKKIVDAVDKNLKGVTVWGTGQARREFMHVKDAAAAVISLIQHIDSINIMNVGWGEDISIRDLAHLIAKLSGFNGTINWDHSKPDGMPRKCMDVSGMRRFGFNPQMDLEQGIRLTIEEYRSRKEEKS